jgi:CBS domain-containing protein
MLIKDLMSAPAITVTGETPASEALRLLDQHKITAMPVVDSKDSLVGVVSEADLMPDALLLDDRRPSYPVRLSADAHPRRVAELMVHLVMSVHPGDELDTAIDLLRASMVKSLPVVDDNRVVGVISRSDVIHVLAGRDTRIRDDVAEALRERNLDWQVAVNDGIVQIRGPIDDPDRRRAEAIADMVRGVIAVHVVPPEHNAG